VPGLGGSSIKTQDNKVIWPPSVWKVFQSNWLDDLSCKYDHTTQKFYLPNKKENCTEVLYVYDPIIKKFDDVHTLPYDFRLIGNKDYLEERYATLKKEIEAQNNRCVLLSHSLGGLLMQDFLINYCTEEWKQKHIKKLCTINTPYAGSVFALNTLLEKRIKYPYTPREFKFEYARYVSGILWTLPNKYLVPDKIVYKDKKLEDLEKIIKLIDIHETYILYNRHFDNKLKQVQLNTNVETHILYSVGMPTITRINDKDTVYIDGDGTVDIESLTFPKKWNYPNYFFKEFKGGHHTILSSKELLNYLEKIL
jgi:hypothetical protein